MQDILSTTYLASELESVAFLTLPIIGSVMVVYAIFELVRDLRKTEHRKLMERLQGKRHGGRKNTPSPILKRSLDDAPTNVLDGVVRKLRVVPKLQATLDQANISWSASRMLINLTGLSILAFLGCMFAGRSPLLAVGLSVVIFIFPIFYVRRRRARRLDKLVEQLPDVFELMTQALAAGHSLASSIQLIGEQVPEPAGTEFERVFQEQNLGIKIEEALKNMAGRVDMMDVRFFVTAVCISRQTGGDLTEVLTKIATIIRQRIELFGQVRALTAEGRMSGWVLLALPLLVYAAGSMLNPEYFAVLTEEPMGRLLLFGAGVSQLMGLAMINYIVKIKV